MNYDQFAPPPLSAHMVIETRAKWAYHWFGWHRHNGMRRFAALRWAWRWFKGKEGLYIVNPARPSEEGKA